jgi:zinc protease
MKFFIGLFIWVLAASTAIAEDLPLTEIVTPQGIHVSYYRSGVQSTVAIALAFKYGLASDDPAKPLAGYVAPELLFDGADGKSAAELSENFLDFGGTFAVYAEADQTYAHISAPTRGISGAVKLANLLLRAPDFPERKILQRRETGAQSVEESASRPDYAARKAFVAAALESNPYQTYFLPSTEAIRHVTRADVQAWQRDHLALDGILVAAAGNLPRAEMGRLIDQLLAGLPQHSSLTAPREAVFKTAPAEAIKIKAETGDQAIVRIGSLLPSKLSLEDWIAGYMLTQIFVSDQKSRLFKDIREATGATYGLQGTFNFFDEMVANFVSGRISKKDSDKTIALVRASWDKFRKDGPSDEEIADARAGMALNFSVMSRNHLSVAGTMRDYLTGHWSTAQIAKLPSIIAKVDLKNTALRSKLFAQNPVVVIAQ